MAEENGQVEAPTTAQTASSSVMLTRWPVWL